MPDDTDRPSIPPPPPEPKPRQARPRTPGIVDFKRSDGSRAVIKRKQTTETTTEESIPAWLWWTLGALALGAAAVGAGLVFVSPPPPLNPNNGEPT
jgi:hypothetical protein